MEQDETAIEILQKSRFYTEILDFFLEESAVEY